MGSLLGKGERGKSASFVAATGLGAPEVRITAVLVSPFTGNKTDRPDKLKLLVVQKMDNAIHQINQYPLDSATGFAITYPLDSDLSIAIHRLNNWCQNLKQTITNSSLERSRVVICALSQQGCNFHIY